MNSRFLFASTALCFGLAVAGCGGATTSSTQRLDTATFALSTSQTGTLSVQSQGNLVSGTLLVPGTGNPTTTATGSLADTLPPGTYGFNGALAPDNTFRATGNVPRVSPFTLTGRLGAGNNSGSFTFYLNSNTNAFVSGGLRRTN